MTQEIFTEDEFTDSYEGTHVEQNSDVSELTESPASEILQNLSIPVSIELSRIRLSLKELGALHKGQIVELNKSPGALVDLMVAGKLIGKGELVEIDGEIGVRVSSLVK